MAAGHPLTDEDRWPWLDTIAAWIDERVAAADEIEEDDEDGADGDMFDELALGGYKSADEVRKIRAKKELYAYALSIGLELGDDYEERKVGDLADEVINFQEEKEAEADAE